MSPTIVYTAGVFDLLHEGHLNVLKLSKKLGDRLIVGVVSDEGTKAYKGKYPVFSEKQRLAYVRALRWVDFAMVQPTTDPTPVIEIVRPHIMTHGDDWQRLKEGHETLERLGVSFILLPYTQGISSTELRNKLCPNG